MQIHLLTALAVESIDSKAGSSPEEVARLAPDEPIAGLFGNLRIPKRWYRSTIQG